jgi:hypothetical protein
MSESRWAHYETWAQMVVGTCLAQIVLWSFGVPLGHALSINAVMFFVSYIKTYAIRRMFHGIRSVSAIHRK